MKKYNKSEIMKKAWSIDRECYVTFSAALRFAWKEAKEIQRVKEAEEVKKACNIVTIADLQAGDIIDMSIGDTEQKCRPVYYTVVSANPVGNGAYYSVKLTSQFGNTTEYFMDSDTTFKLVSKASKLAKVA